MKDAVPRWKDAHRMICRNSIIENGNGFERIKNVAKKAVLYVLRERRLKSGLLSCFFYLRECLHL